MAADDDHERIDPIALAQFMVLPGAVRVVMAFSQIPPGRLRNSAVEHLEAMAEQYSALPGDQGGFDALQAYAAHPPPPPLALANGNGQARPKMQAETPAMRAVILMLEGLSPAQAAMETGLETREVLAARQAAKAQGIEFPRVKMSAVTQPEAPPAAPKVWRKSTRPEKPKQGDRESNYSNGFPLTLAEVRTESARKMIARAASRLGVDMDGLFALRQRTLELMKEGKAAAAIAEILGVDRQTVQNWATRIATSGLLGKTAPAAPRKVGYGNDSFPLTLEELTANGLPKSKEAAGRLGFTLEAYFQARARAVILFNEGKRGPEVASALGIDDKTAQNWKFRIRHAGLLKSEPL